MRIPLSAVVAVALFFTGVHAQESRSAQIQALLKARVDAGRGVGMVAGTVDADGKTMIAAYGNPGPDQEVIWHNGGTGGYRTWLGFDQKKGLAAVVLTNSTHGADDIGFDLLK